MGKVTDLGLAKADDPIYSSGLRISVKPSRPSTKTSPSGTSGDQRFLSKSEGRNDIVRQPCILQEPQV
jgi:hypothetical protein